MFLRLFDATALVHTEAGDRIPVLAVLLSAATVQVALPAAVTASVELNPAALLVVWVLFQAAQGTCRSATGKLLQGLRQDAEKVDSRVELSDCLVFSSPELEAAFERWDGHRVMDWVPNVMAVVLTAGAALKMHQRPDICQLDVQLVYLLTLVLYVFRSVPAIWRQMSLTQRSWTSIGLAQFGMTYFVIRLGDGDKCNMSMFDETGTSTAGMAAMLTIMSALSNIAHPVMIAHSEVHYSLVTAELTAALMIQRLRRTGRSLSVSAEAWRELAALVMLAVVLVQLACTVRQSVAGYNRRMFLASMARRR
eukprot:jgi/Tetstr1/433263/TSEL_022551.t1